MNLQPFKEQDNCNCTKCGSYDIKLRFVAAEDYLRVECNECGFTYGMEPKDRKPAKPAGSEE